MEEIKRIWHISDTHGCHNELTVPDCDIMIYSGDCTNSRDVEYNRAEFIDFIQWATLNTSHIPFKIFVAGNHDTFVFKQGKDARKMLEEANFIYLEDDYTEVMGLKIYGSPWTPTFGSWSFQSDRSKLNKRWSHIPDDIDILITHGPPKGILDLTESRQGSYELTGDSALLKRIRNLSNLSLHCFGHIHNTGGIINIGLRYIDDVIFSNATAVTDGNIGKLSYQGTVILIN